MKSIRWSSSKSIFVSGQEFRDELKTKRQWAKAGYLPISEDCGKKLRPSRWSTGSIDTLPRYLLPEEVRAASADELAAYFQPERERKAAKAAERRAKLRIEREREKEQARLLRAMAEQQDKVHTIAQSVDLTPETFGVIVIDTETTGLYAGEDEILQLSIISENGEKLFDSYFRPLHKTWQEAQAVNHISPEMVADAPTIADRAAEIQRIINSADKIIGYNTYFDVNFISAAGLIIPKRAEIIDIMPMFAEIFGEWSESHGDYKWQKLTTCAEYYHFDWSGMKAHDSLADCFATVHCYKHIICS
ncbi:MAG: 3'-5' exonuclease [Oscillospiraceae bacterium]|nr:3'-5' exonuclease [Oscillospiraceae bacterium]